MKIEFRQRISKSGQRYYIKIPTTLEHLVKDLHKKRIYVIVKIIAPDDENK